jgi:cysteine desulfurase
MNVALEEKIFSKKSLKEKTKNLIYMDYQATTSIDPRVLDEMIDCYKNFSGNPHSRSHGFGWTTEDIIENAREKVADVINADTKDIIFTSGATESNNIAIKGVGLYQRKEEGKDHVITLMTEHKCVLESCAWLEEEGFKVTYLPVKKDGLVDLDQLRNAITDKTCLISIMAVHNEIGVIQPLKEIGQICKEKKVIFHTDAAQAFGKIPLDVEEMNIDLMSISGHKIYGPGGVGALYVRRKPKRIRLKPMMSGGGQERGFRSGTLSAPLIAGFGKAAEIAKNEMEQNATHVKKLFDKLYDGLFNNIPNIYLNGSKEHRYYGNFNVSFEFIEGESLLMGLTNLAVSSGSACTSSSLEASYVLKAIGASEELAHSSIRFGFGKFTKESDIDYVLSITKTTVERLRELSPLWEMAQEGIDISSIQWTHH